MVDLSVELLRDESTLCDDADVLFDDLYAEPQPIDYRLCRLALDLAVVRVDLVLDRREGHDLDLVNPSFGLVRRRTRPFLLLRLEDELCLGEVVGYSLQRSCNLTEAVVDDLAARADQGALEVILDRCLYVVHCSLEVFDFIGQERVIILLTNHLTAQVLIDFSQPLYLVI